MMFPMVTNVLPMVADVLPMVADIIPMVTVVYPMEADGIQCCQLSKRCIN
jgi:hypothetical protein